MANQHWTDEMSMEVGRSVMAFRDHVDTLNEGELRTLVRRMASNMNPFTLDVIRGAKPWVEMTKEQSDVALWWLDTFAKIW